MHPRPSIKASAYFALLFAFLTFGFQRSVHASDLKCGQNYEALVTELDSFPPPPENNTPKNDADTALSLQPRHFASPIDYMNSVSGKGISVAEQKVKLRQNYGKLYPIGKGGEGEVVLVRDKATGEWSLLKLSEDPKRLLFSDWLSNHLHESHARLHPAQPNPFLKTQFLKDLQALKMEQASADVLMQLSRYGPEHLEAALNTISQMSHAVQFANDFGLVHRDIKPHNFLVMYDGRIVLTDFSLGAMKQNRENYHELGVPIGTPTYISEKQSLGHWPEDSMDAYALRISAMEVLLGKSIGMLSRVAPLQVHKKRIKDTGTDYYAFAHSPHTIDPRVPSTISAAVFVPTSSAKEFSARLSEAADYHKRGKDQEYFEKVFSPLFAKLIDQNPALAAANFTTSKELIESADKGWLKLSQSQKESLWKASDDFYKQHEKLGPDIPAAGVPKEFPAPPLDNVAQKQKILAWNRYQNRGRIGQYVYRRPEDPF